MEIIAQTEVCPARHVFAIAVPAALFALAILVAAAVRAPELAQSGYLGGAGTDDCDGIALDRTGDIYLACHTDSADFPGASATSRGGMDAVVIKIEARTGRLAWATRIGGSDWDAAGALALGADGSVYVLGQTQSADFPTTPDAVQRRFGGPRRDAFVLQLDARGKVIYSTFLGGTKNDEAYGFALAGDGTVYASGITMSDDFPGVAARLGPGGAADGFLAALRPGDPHSLRTILVGGKGREQIASLALDGAGNLFAAGFTFSSDFPVKNAVQSRLAGEGDAFLLKLWLSDSSLLFSTFLGGAKIDGASAVAVDAAGNPIVAGVTGSEDFPASARAFQPRRRGSVDAFVAKLAGDGQHVLWSTYYGGSKENADQFQGGDLAVDDRGRVWFTGATNSSDLPLRNALQPHYGGGDFDGFLAALSPDGAALEYGSYVGGAGHEILEGLAIRNGRLYVSGITASRDLPTHRWQVQHAYGGGPYDAFVVGLDNAR